MPSFEVECDEPQLIGRYISKYKVFPHAMNLRPEQLESFHAALEQVIPLTLHSDKLSSNLSPLDGDLLEKKTPEKATSPTMHLSATVAYKDSMRDKNLVDHVRNGYTSRSLSENKTKTNTNLSSQESLNAVSDICVQSHIHSLHHSREVRVAKPSVFEPLYKRKSGKTKMSPNDDKFHLHVRRTSSVPTGQNIFKVVKFKADDISSSRSEELFPKIQLPSFSHVKKKKSSGLTMLLRNDSTEEKEPNQDNDKAYIVLEIEIQSFSNENVQVVASPGNTIGEVIRKALEKSNEKSSQFPTELLNYELHAINKDDSFHSNAASSILDPDEKIEGLNFFNFRLKRKLKSALSLPNTI